LHQQLRNVKRLKSPFLLLNVMLSNIILIASGFFSNISIGIDSCAIVVDVVFVSVVDAAVAAAVVYEYHFFLLMR
jgi:hypothetical protein